MLEKIENAYLAALRVGVLLAASLALLIFAVACSQGIPGLFAQLGWGSSAAVPSAGSLSDFIEIQKAAASEPKEDHSDPSVKPAPAKVKMAAQLLLKYSESRNVDIESDGLVDVLISKRSAIDPVNLQSYDQSLLNVLEELSSSKGEALDVDRINALLNWHIESFNEKAQILENKKVARSVKTTASITLGAVALISFFMIIFFIIFVKIERSIRLIANSREPSIEGVPQ